MSALPALHHLNLGHGLAVSEIRRAATNDPDVSITLNFHVLRGGGDGEQEAMRRIDALANRAFTWPILRGEYPRRGTAEDNRPIGEDFAEAGKYYGEQMRGAADTVADVARKAKDAFSNAFSKGSGSR